MTNEDSKRYLKIAGIVVAVLVVILIALPLFINVNNYRPKIEAQATAGMGRQVKLGNLSLSILSGSVVADDIAIADDPAFSKSPFLTAKSLKVGVELMPLIFSKQLNITDIKLEQPQITLLKTANGKWNFSSIGETSPANTQQPSKPEPAKAEAPNSGAATSGGTPNFSVAKLNVSGGKVIVGQANSSAKQQIYDKVNVDVSNFSFHSQFDFKLSAQMPGGGDANISGKAGPVSAGNADKTPLQTSVKISNMDIAASGLVDPASGLAGSASFDGTLNSDGAHAKAAGTLTGTKLKFSPKGTPAPEAVAVKYAADFDLDKQVGTLTQGDINIGKAVAHLTGSFQSQGIEQSVNMKLDAPDMPVDQLAPMLPSFGVVLPSGSQLQGGTLSATLDIAGPLDKVVITGPVKLANTKLASFDLGSQLGALSSFAGKSASSKDTSIQNASFNARVAPEGTKLDNINLTVPAIGVITGEGTISPAGALNFKMLANLSGGAMGGVTQLASMGGSKTGIPFAIEGTTSNPHFVPNVSGMATGYAKNALGGLTGGKGPGKGNPLSGILGQKPK